MRKFFTPKKFIYMLVLGLTLSACSGMAPKFELNDMSKVKPGNVILVGRITLDPPVTKEEIDLKNCIGCEKYFLHSVYVKITDKYYDTSGSDANYTDSYIANTDGDFYTQYSAKSAMNILGVWLNTGTYSRMFYSFKDGLKVTYPAGTKAIYIGEIYIKRNEFFEIEDLKINQDDYQAANKRFQEKFGTKVNLVPAKLSSSQ